MPVAPAICDTCGTVFQSGFGFEGTGTAHVAGNKSGPCPVCGGMGSVPDGLYEWVGDTLQIISGWTPQRRQHLAAELTAAKTQPDSREAAVAALSKEPDLLEAARRLLLPKNAGEFWAFVAALLAAITLLSSAGGDKTRVNETTVIERVIATPTPPGPVASPATAKKAPPPPPRKQRKAKAKKRH